MRLWFIQNRSGNISSVVERAQRKTISAILCVGLFFSFVPDFFVIIPMFKVYRTDLVHTARTHCHLQLNQINFSLERTAQSFAKINFKQIKIDKIKYMNAVVGMSQRDSKINYNSIWHFFFIFSFYLEQDVLEEYAERVKRRGTVMKIDPNCLRWTPFVPPTPATS